MTSRARAGISGPPSPALGNATPSGSMRRATRLRPTGCSRRRHCNRASGCSSWPAAPRASGLGCPGRGSRRTGSVHRLRGTDGGCRAPSCGRGEAGEHGLQGRRRRGDGPRHGELRRRALSLRLHAHGRPGRGASGDIPRARPGGRAAFAVWGEAGENPWASIPMRAIMEHFDAPAPEPGTPGMFALEDDERVRGLLEDAGFTEIRVERVEAAERYESVEAWWELHSRVAGPAATLSAGLQEPDREAIRARAGEAASAFSTTASCASRPVSGWRLRVDPNSARAAPKR